MFKNQLQELAQRSCFNLPSYGCTREGPDHAPRFKACVNFNGELFECPNYCSTLRQAEHSAAEVALNVLSSRGPSRSLTTRVLDETGVYKNLLQETAHRAGLKLPVYTSIRSGPAHVPVYSSSVEIAGMNFIGDPAKTKKQAEKNAAIAAWSALKTRTTSLSNNNKNVVVVEKEGDQIERVMSKLMRSSKVEESRKRDSQYYYSRRRDNNKNNSMKLLLDVLLDNNNSSTKNKSSFVSLLPPPPPRTTSKILPPKLLFEDMINPIKVLLIEEHQKDEDEWLGSNSNSTTRKQEPIHIASRTNPCSRINNNHLYKIAPAVQIRSVIPVCAAPPRPPPPPAVVSANALEFTQTEGPPEEVSTVNKKTDSPQPILQLGTDFNKKLFLSN